jgi:hypothetical protein
MRNVHFSVTQLPSGILSNLIIARICELFNVNLPLLLFRTPLGFEKFTLKAVHADSSFSIQEFFSFITQPVVIVL